MCMWYLYSSLPILRPIDDQVDSDNQLIFEDDDLDGEVLVDDSDDGDEVKTIQDMPVCIIMYCVCRRSLTLFRLYYV